MMVRINRRFGTWRGLVRLALAQAERMAGRLERFRVADPKAIKRVIFVCHGNICRSAYADAIARDLRMACASVGLSTTTGASSPQPALDAASRQGKDMSGHRALAWEDLEVMPGDLFLAMEIRQAHELRRRLGDRNDVHISLLGLFCNPAVPHLHDPFTLSPEYFDVCFSRINNAVENLAAALDTSPRDHLAALVHAQPGGTAK